MNIGREAPGQQDADVLRVWDWSALIGICSGVAAAAVWYFVDNGHQRPPTVALGSHLAVDVPDTVWWLPFILGFIFGVLGLAAQKLLAGAGLLNSSLVRTGLVIVGCVAGGVAASLAFWLIPQQLVLQDADGHRTSLSPSPLFLLILPFAGLVVGVVLASRQGRTTDQRLPNTM